jgi:hypothetical protein
VDHGRIGAPADVLAQALPALDLGAVLGVPQALRPGHLLGAAVGHRGEVTGHLQGRDPEALAVGVGERDQVVFGPGRKARHQHCRQEQARGPPAQPSPHISPQRIHVTDAD